MKGAWIYLLKIRDCQISIWYGCLIINPFAILKVWYAFLFFLLFLVCQRVMSNHDLPCYSKFFLENQKTLKYIKARLVVMLSPILFLFNNRQIAVLSNTMISSHEQLHCQYINQAINDNRKSFKQLTKMCCTFSISFFLNDILKKKAENVKF